MKNLLILLSLLAYFSCRREQEKHIPPGPAAKLGSLTESASKVVVGKLEAVIPQRMSLQPEIQATGFIDYNPADIRNISARFNGRIVKLYIGYNFQEIEKGQKLMDVYSPEMIAAQKELIQIASDPAANKVMLDAAELRLFQAGFTSQQIKKIEASGNVIDPVPVYSPYSGHIHDMPEGSGATTATGGMGATDAASVSSPALSLREGMFIEKGMKLVSIYGMTQPKIVLNIYPSDMPYVRKGNTVSLVTEMDSRDTVYGLISYIEPVSNEANGFGRVRVQLQDGEMMHKAGAVISARIITDPVEGVWIPASACMDLGSRKIVFLKGRTGFVRHDIKTGVVAANHIEVLQGLETTDSIALNAGYMVDSEGFIK
jgi:Cu(I)/Ag(I) efflux system membrane fusion protein